MAEQPVEKKETERESLHKKIMNNDKDVSRRNIGIGAEYSFGYPFTGSWEIAPDVSVNNIKAYAIEKYGDEEKATAAAKEAGHESLDAGTELHFDEIVSFVPPHDGGPMFINTAYVSSSNKMTAVIIAPFDQILQNPQKGPFGKPIYVEAKYFHFGNNPYIMQYYYRDAEGKEMAGYDERLIDNKDTNTMIEYFYKAGSTTPTKKVFKRTAYSKKM